MSAAAMRALGWVLLSRGVHGGKGAEWRHEATGWRLAHCPPNFGRAWETLRAAAEWCATFFASGAELRADEGPSHWWTR